MGLFYHTIKQATGPTGDQALLISRHDEDRQWGIMTCDVAFTVISMQGIPDGVDLRGKNSEVPENPSTHRRGVFADATGKYQRIDPVQPCGKAE